MARSLPIHESGRLGERALLEKGDADFATGFAPKDFDQFMKVGKVQVTSAPILNCLRDVALDAAKPHLDPWTWTLGQCEAAARRGGRPSTPSARYFLISH